MCIHTYANAQKTHTRTTKHASCLRKVQGLKDFTTLGFCGHAGCTKSLSSQAQERGLHKALSPVGGVRNFTPGHLQICELLLQFSADCKKEDNFGATPLALAARLGSTGSHELASATRSHGGVCTGRGLSVTSETVA